MSFQNEAQLIGTFHYGGWNVRIVDKVEFLFYIVSGTTFQVEKTV
jgi:hypothetical protein